LIFHSSDLSCFFNAGMDTGYILIGTVLSGIDFPAPPPDSTLGILQMPAGIGLWLIRK